MPRTVGEQREDRRLQYQPYIDVHGETADQETWVVENIGRGVALRCVVFTWLPDAEGSKGVSSIMSLGAGQSKGWQPWKLNGGADSVFEPFVPGLERMDVAICEDELGVLHRFGPYGSHETYQRSSRNLTAWANDLLLD